jgi:hypothetical protein
MKEFIPLSDNELGKKNGYGSSKAVSEILLHKASKRYNDE